MASAELQRLLDIFRTTPFDPSVGVDRMRRQMDFFPTKFPVDSVDVQVTTLAGRPAEILAAGDGPRVLYFHGGGYVMGSPASHRHIAAKVAADLKGTVYVLDYRLAPEHPCPAAADDAIAAYEELCGDPISLMGDSAGGGLVVATAIAARDRGLSLPTCMVGLSPWVNVGVDNPSFELLGAVDVLHNRTVIGWYSELYLAGKPTSDAVASPLFADVYGLPPSLMQISDHEVFFGDVVHLHQKFIQAGVVSELSVWPEAFHTWHLHWPRLDEGRAALEQATAFIAGKAAQAS